VNSGLPDDETFSRRKDDVGGYLLKTIDDEDSFDLRQQSI
jgi:hypothetical protein